MRNNLKAAKRILFQLNYILTKRQKKDSVLVFGCMVIGSALELLGVSAIYPFLQMMLNPEQLQNKWYIEWIYLCWPDIRINTVLIIIGGAIILIYLLKNSFMIVSAFIQNAYAAKFQRETSVKMLKFFLGRPYQYFLNTNSSIVLRGIEADISGVYQIQLNIFTLLAECLTICVLSFFLFITDWVMAAGAILLALACLLAVILSFKSRMKKAGARMQKATALKSQYAYQAINGIKEITVLDRRDNFVNQYEEAAVLAEKATVINGFVTACPDRILEGVCISGFIGMVCLKIVFGADINNFIPVLGTFAMAAFKILPSISKISVRINSIIFYQFYLQEVYDNFRETQENKEQFREYVNNCMMDTGRNLSDIKFTRDIKIKNVAWRYLNAKEQVLYDVSLCIRKGESVAFIGSSGAGKTTLADIVMGLLKPQRGSVEMDGVDIYSIPHEWAQIVGYVPQSVFLIDDTVRNNVAFGVNRNVISDDRVWGVLEQAQLRSFIESLPNGLDTLVGERGIKFSGGQRQRIAIARALYGNPDILVLDEATSALDNETEYAVMESVDALRGRKTLVIIAHRLSTIKKCDKIYEIVNGVAVERNKEEVLI